VALEIGSLVGYQPKLLGSAADHIQSNFESDAMTVSDRFAKEVRRLAIEMTTVQRG
jgi:hypothetical protein